MSLLGNRKAAPFYPMNRCIACGYLPIVACAFDIILRQKLYWLECANDACDSPAPGPERSRAQARDKWNQLNPTG
jgi:hypothetical protein